MQKKQKRIGAINPLILAFIGAIAGFFILYIASEISDGGTMLETDFSGFLFNLSLILLAVFAAIYTQIIVHECGHLVFGLASGYKFVSFRVGRLMLIRKSGKLRLKRYKISGTGGQCLMIPPKLSGDDFPYKLYNMGGVIFNLFFALLSILLVLLFDLPNFSNIFLLSFAIFGIIFGGLNGIPMKFSEITNDGYNIRLLNKDYISRKIFYLQLKINGLQSDGTRLKDMPDDWFDLPDNADMENSLHLSMVLLKSARFMDQLKFEEARQCLESIEPYADNLIGLYQKERNCDLLFLEIIDKCRPEVISALYTREIKAYIEKYDEYMFSKKRVLYTYAIAVEQDKTKAETIFNDALRMQDKYPVTGDAESELEIMEYVRKRFL